MTFFFIQWFRDNLPHFYAIAVYAGHCIGYISLVDITITLLRNPFLIENYCMNIKGEILTLEGCYLCYDTVNSKWTRSGNTRGSDRSELQCIFKVLTNEHTRGARGTPLLKFNLLYQYKKNNKSIGNQNCYCKHLREFCGVGCNRNNKASRIADTNKEGVEGVFQWFPNCLQRLTIFSFNACYVSKERQSHILLYLIELGYNLMISTCHNVSTSPGFEVPLAIFGREYN